MFRKLLFTILLIYVGGVVANYSTLIQQVAPNKEPSWMEKVAAGTGAAFWPAEVDWKQFVDFDLPEMSIDVKNIDWVQTLLLYVIVCYLLVVPILRWGLREEIGSYKEHYDSNLFGVVPISLLGFVLAPVLVPLCGIWYLVQRGIEKETSSKKN